MDDVIISRADAEVVVGLAAIFQGQALIADDLLASGERWATEVVRSIGQRFATFGLLAPHATNTQIAEALDALNQRFRAALGADD